MKTEECVAVLQETYGNKLVSVVLYGSVVAGDYAEKYSDVNLLVVLRELGFAELKALTPHTAKWCKKGNPPPLLFTCEQLEQSADVFPIELLDMKQSHRVLFGEEVLDDIEVSDVNLRLQIEHELRSKLLTLREQYLLTQGRPKLLKNLMIQSLSSFLVLFRAALRLFDQEVPAHKLEAVKQLAKRLDFDTKAFELIHSLKQGQSCSESLESLFERYLQTITEVIEAVDAKVLSE